MSVNLYHGGGFRENPDRNYYPSPPIAAQEVIQTAHFGKPQRRVVDFGLEGSDPALRLFVKNFYAASPFGLNAYLRFLTIPPQTRITGFSWHVIDGEPGGTSDNWTGNFFIDEGGVLTSLATAVPLKNSQSFPTWSTEVDPANAIIVGENSYISFQPTSLPAGGLPALKRLKFEIAIYGDASNNKNNP